MDTGFASEGSIIRVGLATPPGALRAGVRSLLTGVAGIEITAEATSIDEWLGLPAAVDVIVATAGAARRAWRQEEFETPILLLVSDPSADDSPFPLAYPHAWGILSLEVESSALQAAIRGLHEGLVVSSPRLLQRLLTGPQKSLDDGEGSEPLTPREMEVLQQLALGLTNKQAALALGISEHTVKYHISSIYSKLGVMNRAEAVHAGIRRGWIGI